MIQVFDNDDAGYLEWLAANGGGYVLNTTNPATREYLMLHRATCRHVTGSPSNGRQWTVQYLKVVADAAHPIESWCVARLDGRPTWCAHCKP